MTEGPGIGGYPELKPPPTRITKAWHSVVTLLYRELPAGVKRSQAARRRMLSRKG